MRDHRSETHIYEVNLYYTTYCTHEVKARSETEALITAKIKMIDHKEVLANLSTWPDGDTAMIIE